jgi:hypothetical protein
MLCCAVPLPDIFITHSGDTFDHAILKSLSPASRNLLARRQHPQQVCTGARGRGGGVSEALGIAFGGWPTLCCLWAVLGIGMVAV